MGISLGLPRGAPPARRRVFVVPHTHWDREWYLPFEEFRVQLVATLDGLLDLLARDDRFRHFTLDGQTVILDDYLEARPERRDEVRRHVASGRLLVGPWFVMPDEFLVGAEALVRNLLRGVRAAAELGPPMLVGYAPDTFGHVSQLPQILRGFGIADAVLWRGVDARVRGNEFIWRAPDGSEVLTHYLRQGYSNAERLPADTGELLERLGSLRRGLEEGAAADCLLLMNGGDHAPPQPELPDLLAAANGRLRDAELVHETLPGFFEAVRQTAARRGTRWDVVEGEFRSPERAHVLAGVLSARMWVKQRNAAAETLLERWAEPFAVFAGLGDQARPLLRLAWRHLLLNQPHDSICGCSIDQVHDEMRVRFDRAEQVAGRVVDQALRAIAGQIDTTAARLPAGADAARRQPVYLAAFNPTDSVRSDFVSAVVTPPAGARTFALADSDGEPVPHQVLSRQAGDALAVIAPRDQVETYLRLAGNGERWRLVVLEKALAALARGALPRLALMACGLRPGRTPGLLEVDVHAAEAGAHDYAALGQCIRDLRAALSRDDVTAVRLRLVRHERVEIGFVARDVPAHGFRLYQLAPWANLTPCTPSPRTERGTRLDSPSMRPDRAICTPSPDAQWGTEGEVGLLDNELFSARVDPSDGTLTILDKETGGVYAGLDAFVDSGEAGDEYTSCPPARDLVVDRPAAQPTISPVASGPARQTVQVDQTYLLPESLDAEREGRAQALVPCAISTRISLYPGVRRVDFETTVDNAAKDHLLRVRFPTGIHASHSHAAGHFAVEARPIAVPPKVRGWPEQPAATLPHAGFVDVSDGRRGLLVAARGLPEAAALPGDSGVTIYLTLLRCVGWLSRDDLATRQGAAGPVLATPGAQCPGRHVFHYSVVPHRGTWEEAAAQARAFAAPLRAVAVEAHPGPLPPTLGFLDVEPASVVVSAVKPAEEGEGFVVRVYNPTDADAQARLRVWRHLLRAELANLNESGLEDLPVDGSTVRFPVRAGQVVTLRLHLAGEPRPPPTTMEPSGRGQVTYHGWNHRRATSTPTPQCACPSGPYRPAWLAPYAYQSSLVSGKPLWPWRGLASSAW